MSLGKVINCLTSGTKEYIPYKDSKLTRILKDSLGGNFKTTLIVTCSPHYYNIDETISTLNFAKRAKKIKNIVKANIKRAPEELERAITLLQQELKSAYEEIRMLKQEGNQKTNNVNTNVNTINIEIKTESPIKINQLTSQSEFKLGGNKIILNNCQHEDLINAKDSIETNDLRALLQSKDDEITKLKEEILQVESEKTNLQVL